MIFQFSRRRSDEKGLGSGAEAPARTTASQLRFIYWKIKSGGEEELEGEDARPEWIANVEGRSNGAVC